MNGHLVLVVGPSGAGKDSLMAAAHAAFAGDPAYVFARRVVTRPASCSEDNDTASEDSFTAIEAAGGFLLSWRAHGLAYGVPAHYRDDLQDGRLVVANVSRGVIEEAERLGCRVTVLLVTASPQVLAARIAARGRESAADIAARLSREAPVVVSTARLVEIRNDGALAEAEQRFVEALSGCGHGAAPAR